MESEAAPYQHSWLSGEWRRGDHRDVGGVNGGSRRRGEPGLNLCPPLLRGVFAFLVSQGEGDALQAGVHRHGGLVDWRSATHPCTLWARRRCCGWNGRGLWGSCSSCHLSWARCVCSLGLSGERTWRRGDALRSRTSQLVPSNRVCFLSWLSGLLGQHRRRWWCHWRS